MLPLTWCGACACRTGIVPVVCGCCKGLSTGDHLALRFAAEHLLLLLRTVHARQWLCGAICMADVLVSRPTRIL